MKKVLLFFAAVFALLNFSFSASGAEMAVKFNLDDASRVIITVNDVPQEGLKTGYNEVTIDSYDQLIVKASEGNTLVSVLLDNNPNWDEWIYGEGGERYCEINYPDDEYVYYVYTASNSEVETATLTVKIDDPSKAVVTIKETDKTLELTQGDNTIQFNPDVEKTIKIEPTGKDLYRVVVNDTPLASSWSYTIDINDGDVIDIQSNYPDIDCKVQFLLSGDEVEDFITRVEVDGKYAPDYLSPDFTVKAGSELTISANTQEWEVLKFTLNGVSATLSNPTTILVDRDLTVVIEVQKYATFKVTVNIDDPTHIILYNGYSFNGKTVDLQKGENIIDVIRQGARLEIVPVDGFCVESIVFSDDQWSPSEEDLRAGKITLDQLVAGDYITIKTAEIVRDLKGVLFVSNLEAGSEYLSFIRADGKSPVDAIAEGYNHFEFYERDNLFRLETGAPVPAHVYVNEQKADPVFPDSPNYNLDLDDNAVVKVFFAQSAPEAHTVVVEIPQGLEDIVFTHDHIATPQNWQQGLSLLHGTHCTINPNGKSIKVSNNDTDLKADEDGNFNFVLEADSNLKIEDLTTGIDNIVVEGVGAEGAVYTINGVKVFDNATTSDLKKLGKGIYIIGGGKYLNR